MGSLDVNSGPAKPWVTTPLIFSSPLSRLTGCNIYLKLDLLQPSGSFKSRGIGNMMALALHNNPSDNVHFFCSSSGNAGLACATSAMNLARPCTIVAPTTTSPFMAAKLRALGATVIQSGNSWFDADTHLRREFLDNPKVTSVTTPVYVPPFDHPDIWEGASSLVDEIAAQAAERFESDSSKEPQVDAIVCNVGGGGLLNGVMLGLSSHLHAPRSILHKTRVLAVETKGADSLHQSVLAGEHVTLPAITSIATSLGAIKVSDKTWEWAQLSAQSQLPPGRGAKKTVATQLMTTTVSDAEAAMACVRFLDDARLMVEVACGATLATLYNGRLRKEVGRGRTDDEWKRTNVVVVVCGGSAVNMEILRGYVDKYAGEVQF